MSTGELLTRWTVRMALVLYVLALMLRFCPIKLPVRFYNARLCWTAGCLLFFLHMVCAFHFYHHWSHDDAYEATARQTREVVGFDWGGGLYANYAFAFLWLVDVCWWWYDVTSYNTRSRGIEGAVQGFMAFMAFNATVVFGQGAIRWFGGAVCLILAVALGYHVYARRRCNVR